MGSITAIYDPEHQLTLSGRLGQLCGRRVGRVYGSITSSRGRLEALANALLVGLGKEAMGRDLQRNATIKWWYTLAWLSGEQASTVFLAGVDVLTREARKRVRDLADDRRDIFLIYSDSRTRRWLAAMHPEFRSPAGFLEQWASISCVEPDPPFLPYPRVPEVEFARFRNACHQELPPEQFGTVNRTWRRVHRDVLESIDLAGGLIDENFVAELLQRVICTCDDYQESVVAIRAAQAALLTRGYLVKLLMSRFARAAQLASPADLDRGIADRLRWYAGSARPAAGLIRLLAPAPTLEEIAAIDAPDIAADGSTFHIGGVEIDVPESGRGLLRTQHAARALLRATSPRFLVYTHGLRQLEPTPGVISGWLRELTVEAGISLAGATSRRARLDAPGWVSRRGIAVQPLGDTNAQ